MYLCLIYIIGFFILPFVAGAATFEVGANKPYATIQEAVDRADSGDFINIGPGVYDEQVVINDKSLEITGTGDSSVIKPSGPEKLKTIYTYSGNFPLWPGAKITAIVMVRNSGDVVLGNLKIDGSNITAMPADAERLAGILYSESGGVIQNITVEAIRTSGAADRTYGIDISAVDNEADVEIVTSKIGDFLKNGIQAIGGRLSVNIHDNSITGPDSLSGPSQIPNGIVLAYGVSGRISNNAIGNLHSFGDSWNSAGILLWGEFPDSVLIKNNEIFETDYGLGLSNNASKFLIEQNRLHSNKTGIMLESGAFDNKITGNYIVKNIQGFQIHGAKNSNSTGNKPPGAGNRALANFITDNKTGIVNLDDSQEFDARDNWWGNAEPDFPNIITGLVNYSPWRTKADQTVVTENQGSSLPTPLPVVTSSPALSSEKFSSKLEEVSGGGPALHNLSGGGPALHSLSGGGAAQLFDIRLLFDRGEVSNVADLIARVTFTSFGRAPTPVEMTFSILDDRGNEVWEITENTIVETERVFVKDFAAAPPLEPGEYKLKLRTRYNINVEDVFETQFRVLSVDEKEDKIFVYSIGTLAVVIVFLILWLRRVSSKRV